VPVHKTIVVSVDPLSPTPSTTLAMQSPESTEDPEIPEPANEGDIQMEYFSDSHTAQHTF
jgi:hypothetical protein